MVLKLDTELDLKPRTDSKYIISSPHRKINGNPEKCIWTITRSEEVECFILSRISNWFAGTSYWGLKLEKNLPASLGKNYRKEILKIAKFVGGVKKDIWHGYPADYVNRPHDKPDISVLQMWIKGGHIGKHHMRKIRQGVPCNL